MLPEIGHFAIILSLCFAILQTFYFASTRFVRTAAHGQLCFLTMAMCCLIGCFLTNDLTVVYVREHSHQLLPTLYKVGAAWGGHEGSLLLWCCILSGWTVAFSLLAKRKLAHSTYDLIIAILGLINAGFILFLLFTSNPFARSFPTTLISGEDLTPILQDPGLLFHPPMLYLGYVGFAVGFAFAIAALIERRIDQAWVKACRPWVILPWSFLSLGIVLGSWWAYRELGWGGWWFWDPVENASLLPWLASTALIHSLVVSDKRGVFYGWVILLAIITFALCLLGTFLVRSGVLVSVHAFANDPTRGVFLLLYLAFIVGGALTLYALRIRHFYQEPKFSLFSRETLLLINSIFLLTAVVTIVLGTLYPIILDSLQIDKISVGEPYFNSIFIPLILPLFFLMGLAPHVNWGKQTLLPLLKKLFPTFLLSLVLSASTLLILGFNVHYKVMLGTSLSVWIILATLHYGLQTYRLQKRLTRAHLSMMVAHLGIAILALGVTLNKTYSDELQLKMAPHDTIIMSGYPITLEKIETSQVDNYQTTSAYFTVKNQVIVAEQRIYLSHQQLLSKTAILVNWWRDIYIALGSELPDHSWSVRIYYKPFVRWIWFGGILLLVGGLLSLGRATHEK